MTEYFAGNTLGTAKAIELTSSLQTVAGSLSPLDINYGNGLTLNNRSSFNMAPLALGANAHSEVLRNSAQLGTSSLKTHHVDTNLADKNGYLMVQPSGETAWYGYGTGQPSGKITITAEAIPPEIIKKYLFTYYYGNGDIINNKYYGNGDYYKGYAYAKDGTYSINQIIEQHNTNSTGKKGFYKITDVTPYGSSSDVGKSYITYYYDGDTSKQGFTSEYNTNYALGYGLGFQGLGGESDFIGTQYFSKGVELDFSDPDGNTSISTAYRLNGNVYYADGTLPPLDATISGQSIGGGIDRHDYYSFTLDKISDAKIQLDGLSAGAGFLLLKDTNSNGLTDIGESLGSSSGGTAAQSMTTTLAPGTYYIAVSPDNPYEPKAKTNYNLRVSATPEKAGNTSAEAYNIGNLSGSQSLQGLLRTNHDNDDYYRFSIDRTRDFNLTLDGLNTRTGNIDGLDSITGVELIRESNNEVLQSSSGTSTSPGSISRTLQPGNYYVRVSPITAPADTSYNLNMNAIPKSEPEIPINQWNARFINRTPENVADFNSYDFSQPVAIISLGSQNRDGGIGLQLQVDPEAAASGKVQKDNFAVQAWTRTNMQAGKLYKLTTKSDDGTKFSVKNIKTGEIKRLEELGGWSDGEWRDRASNEPEKIIYFKAPESGDYDFHVQYYERTGDSIIDFSVQETQPFNDFVEGQESNHWKSNFFWWDRNQGDKPPVNFYENSANQIGAVNLGSSDRGDGKRGINFNWHDGLPNNDSRLPGDFFAIRSYTQAYFEAGKQYRAWVNADDGLQLLAKQANTDQWVYFTDPNNWEEAYGGKWVNFEVPETGMYDLHFHHYERGGDAHFDLFWEEVPPPQKPDIKIELVDHYGQFTPSQWAKIQQAAANWERIITKDKDSSGILKISVNKGRTQKPGWFADTLEDKAVNYRTNFNEPSVDLDGVDYHNNIRFNTSQFSYAENNNLLVRVAMHEIGNALGLPDDNGSPNLMNHDNLNPLITETIYRRLEELGYSVDSNVFIDWNESGNTGGGNPGDGNPGDGNPGGGNPSDGNSTLPKDEFFSIGTLGELWGAGNSVSSNNRNDYYSFNIDKRSNLQADFKAIDTHARLSILPEGGVPIPKNIDAFSGSASWILEPGNYQVKIENTTGDTDYNFSLHRVNLAENVTEKGLTREWNWGWQDVDNSDRSGEVNLYRYKIKDLSDQEIESEKDPIILSDQGIESKKDTIIVIHGRNDSSEGGNIKKLLEKAAIKYSSTHQILALDWNQLAAHNDDSWHNPPYNSARAITPVADWAVKTLKKLGIGAENISLFGHSLGSYVSAEIGRLFAGRVENLVAIDPAFPGTQYDIDGNSPGHQGITEFKQTAKHSLAFVVKEDGSGSIAGDGDRANTAHNSLVISYDGWANPLDPLSPHNTAVDVVADALLKEHLLLKNNLALPIDLVENKYENSGINIKWGIHEGRVTATRDGNIKELAYMKGSSWDSDAQETTAWH